MTLLARRLSLLIHNRPVASWFQALSEEQTALDLGCGSGTAYGAARCRMIAVDVRPPKTAPSVTRGGFVQADARRLPFGADTCDLVVAQHSFEHIADWPAAAREAARVLAPGGLLVVAIPDGYSLSDAVYRFLDKGREHVNRFDGEDFVEAIERETALRLTVWRPLYASYSFLCRRPGQRFGGRAAPLNWVPAPLLRGLLLAWSALARSADRHLGTRWTAYGWQFEFRPDAAGTPVRQSGERNVCIACGCVHPAAWLVEQGAVRGRFVRRYRCPACGALNLFFA